MALDLKEDTASLSSESLPSVEHTLGSTTKSFGFGELQQDFAPKFEFYKKHNSVVGSLKWQHASYSAGDKKILNNVTGHINSGEVLAIMGFKGAGKTSLLDLLAGRIIPKKNLKWSGEFYLNGQKLSPLEYREHVAYVTNVETLYLTDTPEETLHFSMKLRFPKIYTKSPKHVSDLINEVLKSFDLYKIKDRPLRTLDKAAHKRTAIAVELLGSPRVLFLEEPLKGLNSFQAWKMLVILHTLTADTGCAVIMTIQQPTSEIFHELQNVHMLSHGEVLYNGKVSYLTKVMAKLGHPIPQLTNPADYMFLLAEELPKEKLFKFNRDTGETRPNFDITELEQNIKGKDEVRNASAPLLKASPKASGVNIWFTELFTQVSRDMKWMVRSDSFRIRHIYLRAVIQGVFGLLFWQSLDREDDFNFTVGLVAATFSTMFLFIPSTVLTLKNFPADRTRFLLEYRKGTYSAATFFLSQLWLDLINNVTAGIVTFVLFYLIMGATANLGYLILMGSLISLSANSLSIFLGATIATPSHAIRFALPTLVPKIFFSGMLVPMPSYLNWFQYLSLIKYGLTDLLYLEFDDCGSASDLGQWNGLAVDCTDENLAASGQFDGTCEDLLDDLTFTQSCVSNFTIRDLQLERWDEYLYIQIGCIVVFRFLSLAILIDRARKFTK